MTTEQNMADLIARYESSVQRKLMERMIDIFDVGPAQEALKGCVMGKKLQQAHLAIVAQYSPCKQMALFEAYR